MSIVLIGASAQLAPIRQRGEYAGALAFADTDALRALDTITRQRPDVVALERMFAETSRGAALINRIKADPALTRCEIRVVDQERSDVSAAAPPAPAPPTPLDRRGTRRAPRYAIVPGVELSIDGNPAVIIDLSTIGAQVVSSTVLKPNQRVRLSLPDTSRPLRFGGLIAWAAFEMPREGTRYRAGIEFYDNDIDSIDRFIAAHRA